MTVGADPLAVCPGRKQPRGRVGPEVLSFGDGHHRCPGAYLAIQETDILLRRLFTLPGFRLTRRPDVNWSDIAHGYELRNFRVAVD